MDLGELQPLQNLNQLTELKLGGCYELTGQSESESCSGHNQHVISLADSRNTGSIGGLEPITIAQYFVNSRVSNETRGSVSEIVGVQPSSHVIG